jgi:hypothetical protein
MSVQQRTANSTLVRLAHDRYCKRNDILRVVQRQSREKEGFVEADRSDVSKAKNRSHFRIGELNPGLVGTDHREMIESDKS